MEFSKPRSLKNVQSFKQGTRKWKEVGSFAPDIMKLLNEHPLISAARYCDVPHDIGPCKGFIVKSFVRSGSDSAFYCVPSQRHVRIDDTIKELIEASGGKLQTVFSEDMVVAVAELNAIHDGFAVAIAACSGGVDRPQDRSVLRSACVIELNQFAKRGGKYFDDIEQKRDFGTNVVLYTRKVENWGVMSMSERRAVARKNIHDAVVDGVEEIYEPEATIIAKK